MDLPVTAKKLCKLLIKGLKVKFNYELNSPIYRVNNFLNKIQKNAEIFSFSFKIKVKCSIYLRLKKNIKIEV